MTEIKDLTTVAAIAGNDQFPLWATADSATRKTTASDLVAYVGDTLGLDARTVDFGTRAEAVAAIASLQGLTDGMTFRAAGLEYRREFGATAISDLLGFVPNGDPSLGHWNALMDGTTNDAAALQAMLNYTGTIKIPRGKTVRCATTLTVPAGLTFFEISAEEGGIVYWDPATAINFLSFANYTVNTRLPQMTVRNFEIYGNQATNLSYINSYPMLVSNVANVQFRNVKVSYSRVMGIVVRAADFVSVTGCEVHHCARDGINLGYCVETVVANNIIHHCDDDAIAVSCEIYSWQRGHTITGNLISHGQGIRCLGIQVATITGNTIQYFFSQGISVSTIDYGVSEIAGIKSGIAINISGNTLSDAFNRTFLDNLNSGVSYIRVGMMASQNGSLTYVPGWRGTTPYGYYQNVKSAAEMLSTTPIPENGDIIVSNNVMKRTLPRTGMFSAQGLGQFWLRTGNADYDLSSATAAVFVVLAGYINRMSISGNICAGEDQFLNVVADSGTVRPIRNCKVRNNIVSDIRTYAVSCVASTETLDIEFSGNIFDLDPYHIHANRSTNGTFLVAANQPQALLRQGALGMHWRDNDFKNMARFAEGTVTNLTNGGLLGFEGNRFWADPAADGFSTSNKGVGEMPATSGVSLVHVECDPASANFGKVYRTAGSRSAAKPTTGTFTTGEYIEKSTWAVAGAASSKYVIRGWLRLTTGTAHVADTDWAEARTLTGT